MFGSGQTSVGVAQAGGGGAAAWLEALRLGRAIPVRAVAVVAHPDDETVGFGLRLPRFSELALIHVTDGAPDDMGDAARAGYATRQAYARARAEELDEALEVLGAEPRRVGLGLRDQTAFRHMAWLARALQRWLDGAELVLTHAYEGGHPDHDACAFAVQAACSALAAAGRRAPVRLEFAGYHRDPSGELAFGFWPEPGGAGLRACATAHDVARKAAALARHRSQGRITAWFDPALETYRAAPRYDFTRAPPPGATAYDDWGWPVTSGIWRLAAGAALAELGART